MKMQGGLKICKHVYLHAICRSDAAVTTAGCPAQEVTQESPRHRVQSMRHRCQAVITRMVATHVATHET